MKRIFVLGFVVLSLGVIGCKDRREVSVFGNKPSASHDTMGSAGHSFAQMPTDAGTPPPLPLAVGGAARAAEVGEGEGEEFGEGEGEGEGEGLGEGEGEAPIPLDDVFGPAFVR